MPSACRVGTRQSDRQQDRRRDGRFSLPSVPGALDKAFAECPIKDTQQRGLCRSNFYRVFFAECRTQQRLCRVQFGLYRVPQALGKEPEFSSDRLHVTTQANTTTLKIYPEQGPVPTLPHKCYPDDTST